MAEPDLSGFAGDLFGTGESTGGPTFDVPYTSASSGLNLPPTAPPEVTPWYQGAADFAGKVGTGLEKEFSEPLKSFSSALGLGATGFNISNQLRTAGAVQRQTANIEKQQKQAQAAAAPAVEFGQEQLAAGRAGKLPPPMQAAVEQWKQQAKADMRARLAAMGLGNSTDLQSEEAKIDLMGESMKAQLLQGQETVGLEGLKTGVSAATSGAQTSTQQQQLLTQLIAGADQQLAKLGSTQP